MGHGYRGSDSCIFGRADFSAGPWSPLRAVPSGVCVHLWEPCLRTNVAERPLVRRGGLSRRRGRALARLGARNQNDARNGDPHERKDECENTDEWHEEADAKDERSPPQPSLDSLATKKPTCRTEHHRPGRRQQRVDDVAAITFSACMTSVLSRFGAVGECRAEW